VTGILFGKTFSQKHMSKMSSAIGAHNFGPNTIGIGYPFYRALDLIVEAGPPAMGLKLIFRAVQGRIASFAGIGTFFFIIQQFSRERPFGAFMQDYLFFFWG